MNAWLSYVHLDTSIFLLILTSAPLPASVPLLDRERAGLAVACRDNSQRSASSWLLLAGRVVHRPLLIHQPFNHYLVYLSCLACLVISNFHHAIQLIPFPFPSLSSRPCKNAFVACTPPFYPASRSHPIPPPTYPSRLLSPANRAANRSPKWTTQTHP